MPDHERRENLNFPGAKSFWHDNSLKTAEHFFDTGGHYCDSAVSLSSLLAGVHILQVECMMERTSMKLLE
jgi:hypothetical protein